MTETTSTSGRIMEVIGDAEASHEFNYSVQTPAGMSILPQDDGSVLIGRQTTKGDTQTVDVDAIIGAPWALDADGHTVPVAYSVGTNGSLRMVVKPTAGKIAYPIVADPTVTKGGFRATWSTWSPHAVKIYLNRARTADAEDLGAVICVGIAFVPVVGAAEDVKQSETRVVTRSV